MEKEYLTINEVAEALGVSTQTIRNWEIVGELRPSRTLGGHRRYKRDTIINLKEKKVIFSYEFVLSKKIKESLVAGLQAPDDQSLIKEDDLGDYSIEDMNILLYRNFDICNSLLHHDQKGKYREFYYKSLTSMLVNKLVYTEPMCSESGLIYYKRHRHCNDGVNIVYESESIVYTTLKSNTKRWEHEDEFHGFKEIIKNIDQEIVTDLLINAGTVKLKNFNNSIEVCDIIDAIILKTCVTPNEGHFWIAHPPEVELFDCQEVKISNTFVYEGFEVKQHQTRLIPENQILVGFKSNSTMSSYCFAPMCLVVTDSDNEQCGHNIQAQCAIYAKKLLREGSNFYGRLDLEDIN